MMLLSKKELAELAGYSYRQLYNIDRDLPAQKKLFVLGEGEEGKKGKCDAAVFVQRWVEYRVTGAISDTDDLETVKARHEAIKIQKSEIELAKMRGEVLDAAEVVRLWADITAAVQNRFLTLAKKLAPVLATETDPVAVEGMIDREIRDILELIADTPLPGYEPTEEQAEEPEE